MSKCPSVSEGLVEGKNLERFAGKPRVWDISGILFYTAKRGIFGSRKVLNRYFILVRNDLVFFVPACSSKWLNFAPEYRIDLN